MLNGQFLQLSRRKMKYTGDVPRNILVTSLKDWMTENGLSN